MALRSDYYVYALYREDGVTPFYIGMGSGDRWLRHEIKARNGTERRNSHKAAIIRQMQARGIAVPKRQLFTGLPSAAAGQIERFLISLYGRQHEGGPLVNYAGGGEGCFDPSPETRRKRSEALRGRSFPHLREQMLGKPKSPEHVAKMRAANLGKKMSAESSAKKSAATKGKPRPHTPEHQAALSAAVAAAMARPEVRAAMSAARRGKKQSPEFVAKRASAVRATFARRRAEAV